jgi:peptide/nickel transport system permease protein/glutathione transport system permease protein
VARYAAQRIIIAIPVLLVVLTIIFLAVRVAPGDPALAVLGDRASDVALDAVRERMGLNDPLPVQFWDYLTGIIRGDLGVSLVTGRSAAGMIGGVLPHTVQLTVSAVLLGLLFGIPTGVWAAVYRNRWPDYLGRVVSLAGLSFPAFYLAILLIMLFAVYLGWFPTTGVGAFSDPVQNLRHLILPAVTLGLIAGAYVTRVTRSVVLNILTEDFVRTARSKGLAERIVLYRHALRPGLIPVASLVGIFTITLLGSAVTTEIVFARPGLGRLLVNATMQRDYGLIQGVVVVFGMMVVLVNVITDIVYGALDPKVRSN